MIGQGIAPTRFAQVFAQALQGAPRRQVQGQRGKAVTPKFLQDLRERAAAKRANARRIEAEACREDAAYRADVGITRAADALQAA